MRFRTNDGGRREAGWKGKNAGDCVPRAIAVALDLQYRDVRSELDRLTKEMTGGFDTTTNNGTTAPSAVRLNSLATTPDPLPKRAPSN